MSFYRKSGTGFQNRNSKSKNRDDDERQPPKKKLTGAEARLAKRFTGGGKITAIEYQATNTERVNIFIDDEYAFSLSANLTVERRLQKGLTLSAEQTDELQTADLYNRGLSAALGQLATRPRSATEISQYLRKKYPDAPPETAQRVIARLTELNYLNDESFARLWVENRASFAPRGRNLLKQELMRKGVAKDIIEATISAYLEERQEEADAESEDGEALPVEEAQALEAARKKARSYAAEDWNGFYRKLGGFLLRRGYDYPTTGRVVKQVWRELKEGVADDEADDYAPDFD